MEKKKKKKLFLLDFTVAGTFSLWAQSASTPISNFFILLKNNMDLLHESNPFLQNYKLLRELVKDTGFFKFQKGNLKNIKNFVPRQTFNFAFFEYYNRIIRKDKSNKNISEYIFLNSLLTGALAGITTHLIFYPFLNFNKYVFRINYYTKKNLNEKIKNQTHRLIYRKIHFELITIIPYTSIYFGIFNSYIENLNKINLNHSQKFIFANFVCLMAEIVNYPFFALKNKIKSDSGFFFKRVYFKDLIQCYFNVDQSNRAAFFYKGFFHLERMVAVFRGALLLFFFNDYVNVKKLNNL